MMTTVHALVWSGILTFLMLLVASGICAQAWTPPGAQIAFGNRENLPTALGLAGRADRAAKNQMEAMVMLLALQMVYVCLVYGPIAAFLVELFPTRIRYTSMSLPYHLGNGWFGGFLPLIATAVTTSAWAQRAFGPYAIYGGLLYPIAIAAITLVVGGLWIHETKDHRLDGSHPTR